MNSNQIRKSFLDFFKSKEHKIVDSAAVIAYDDPTLMFINAGMNQFKDIFLGSRKSDYKRIANTQKCIRVSGKHNDLEEVGVDTYHHTLFEMLGNWSFGDYYKAEAIAFAWELLTQVWKLSPDRLYATVYRTDDEAFELWKKYLPENRIQRFDEKDNFWEMGTTGPCGPCSEIHYDRTADMSGANLVNSDSPDVMEIWNLVFIQFNRKADGSLEPLANKFIDTGMGFERICSIIQNVKSNYDTDIFTPLLNKISELSSIRYGADNNNDVAMRVIADHIRALTFAIADGALPGNEGRSYVLRRILRRGLRYARHLGFREPMMYLLVETLVKTMGDYFKEIVEKQTQIERVIKGEEESFLLTMDRGIEKIDFFIQELKNNNQNILNADDTFLLYDTYGFPLDLTELIAREKNIKIDIDGFNLKMDEQKERSRSARKQHSQEIILPSIDAVSEFIGYDTIECEAAILYAKDNLVVVDRTPFYVESGGQVEDYGKMIFGNYSFDVIDVKNFGEAIFHLLKYEKDDFDISDFCKIGDKIKVKIDVNRRLNIVRNHTATHLLHQALRQVLGEHIQQSGSLVSVDHLRFDFNHFEKIQQSQLIQIEQIVNQQIQNCIDIKIKNMSIDEAKQDGKIKMFFGDKYGEEVRAVFINDFSAELCGGTHCQNTSEITAFKIISESSVAAGIRRIEAVTGSQIYLYLLESENKIQDFIKENEELKSKIKHYEKIEEKIKKADKIREITSLAGANKINDFSVFVANMELDNLDQLRTVAEKIRETGKSCIALIATTIDEKIHIAVSVSDDLKEKYPAGKLVGEAAKFIGGNGGGKSHLATAGGKDKEKLEELIKTKFYHIIENWV